MNGSFGNDENGNLVVGNNNQPFILALILGALQQLVSLLGGSSGGGAQRTLTSTAPTTSGSVAAGAKAVSFVTSSDWSGSINGAVWPASASKNISPPNPADTLPAIAYVVTTGTLYIDVLT